MLSTLNYPRSFLDYFRYYVRISYTYKLATDIEGYFIYTGWRFQLYIWTAFADWSYASAANSSEV